MNNEASSAMAGKQRARPRAWWRAARPVAHGMIALPIIWGQALAWSVAGEFMWHWFLLIQAYAVFLQVYILYLNDYADEAVDRLNSTYWLSGGSRVIPDGQLTGRQLYKASYVALAGMLLVAIACATLGRPMMLLWVLLSAALAWTYSLAPLKSSYRGWGEVHQAVACGAVLPLMAYYLQAGSLAAFPWLMLLPFSLVFFAGNIVTALADTPADERGGKRSFPVRHGEKVARRAAVVLLALSYGLTMILRGPGISEYWMGLTVGMPPLIILALVFRGRLLAVADAARQRECKRFVLILSASQLWFLVSWTILLCWQGMLVR